MLQKLLWGSLELADVLASFERRGVLDVAVVKPTTDKGRLLLHFLAPYVWRALSCAEFGTDVLCVCCAQRGKRRAHRLVRFASVPRISDFMPCADLTLRIPSLEASVTVGPGVTWPVFDVPAVYLSHCVAFDAGKMHIATDNAKSRELITEIVLSHLITL